MAWDEQTGVSEVDDILNPFVRRKGLLRALTNTGENEDNSAYTSGAGGAPGDEAPRLAHRINDDSNTAGNRSGGPAGGAAAIASSAPYQDPGQGRLKDLMAQERTAEAPTPPTSMKRRLLTALADAGPAVLAGAMGSAGGAVGADQAMQKGVARRHEQEDLAAKNKRENVTRLKDQIERESQGMEQRTFQHGEDTERNRVTEEGLNARARIAQEAETGRNNRLVETIKGQSDRQQAGFGQQDELEDRKQVNRMELQRAKDQARAAIARMKASQPTKIPPLVGKSFDTYETSVSRLDVMEASYKKAIKDPGDSQAMINLLANHLGMTMGLQPGARMNQAIINEAMKSGYLDERIEAHFGPDGYLTGVVLTPRQMSQMLDLARGRVKEDSRKVEEMETYFNVKGGMRPSPTGSQAPTSAGGAAGGGAGGAGATSSTAPKTAEDYLKKRKGTGANAGPR